MVRRLASLFEDLDRPAGLLGRAGDHVGKQLTADQSRTRTRHQHAARLEHLEGGDVEFQVALECPLDVAGLPGKLGRVADDDAEALSFCVQALQNLEDVPLLESSAASPLIEACSRAQFDRVRRAVDPKGAAAPLRDGVQGEAAREAEEVEHLPPAAIPGGSLAIEPLVEIKARFLPGAEIDVVGQAVFDDRDRPSGIEPGDDLLGRWEAALSERFLAPSRRIMPSAPVASASKPEKQLAAFEERQARELNGQPPIVAIDRESGEPVTFARDEPVGGLVSTQPERSDAATGPPRRSGRTRMLRPAGPRPSGRA